MSENLLRFEASPYLLQHKDNPVHWRAWNRAALDEARAADKPILLSVGYAACHWCHVMAHESFEDEATAALVNEFYVPIKVDREERPDVDQIYMAALHSLGEQGGWPLTMFLTPAGEPVWGGTYFPPTARYGRPAFRDVLTEVARLFREEPDKITQNRDWVLHRLKERKAEEGGPVAADRTLLDAAAERLLSLMDPANGGTRGAPKFPQATLLEALWRAGERTQDHRYTDAVLLTLSAIANGGIYDHVGGGFARYSTDERWLVPHFEKMLYDNAQLIELMTYAWLQTGEALFARRVEETIAWLVREMRQEGGAFAASLDADSDGHEGRFYVWRVAEVIDVLGADDGAFFADAYDISEAGNWEGASIPNRIGKPALDEGAERRLAAARAKLLERRSKRVRPATDDKILADWNGLAIAALAFAGASFGRSDWIELAQFAYGFVAGTMSEGGRLAHSWRAGKGTYPALATDYAAMIKGALGLHVATMEPAWLTRAAALAAAMRAHHWNDAEPGYFLSADDADPLIVRPRAATDEATPSATGLMAQNLVRLWHLTGSDAYRADADAVITGSGSAIAANLFATTGLLNALDLRLGAIDVLIVTPAGGDGAALIAAARAHATPNTILSRHQGSARLPAGHPAAGKTTVDGAATAYVCRGEVCSLPVTEANELAALLAAPSSLRP